MNSKLIKKIYEDYNPILEYLCKKYQNDTFCIEIEYYGPINEFTQEKINEKKLKISVYLLCDQSYKIIVTPDLSLSIENDTLAYIPENELPNVNKTLKTIETKLPEIKKFLSDRTNIFV